MPEKARGTHVPGAPLTGLPSARGPGRSRRLPPPGCGGLAPALRDPGSGVRFFVPAHARPILTDRVRGSPVTNRSALPAFPAPLGTQSTAPSAHVVWACAARLVFGCSVLGGFLCSRGYPEPACAHLSGRSLLPVLRLLLGFGSPRRPGGTGCVVLFTSAAEPVVASGREMVVVSVPAEVTVILLDIEGTTTPIAFVKVRGGRERGSYLCLKASEKEIFQCCGFCLWAQGEVVWLCVSGMGKSEAAGGAFPRATIFSLPCLCFWLGRKG